MTRWRRSAALVVGVIIGFMSSVAIGAPAGIEPSPTPAPGPDRVSTDADPPTSTPARDGDGNTTTSPPIDQARTYLVWSTGGLTPELVSGLRERFEEVSVVKGDVVELEAEDGVIPLDALALDPIAHQPFDPDRSLGRLRPGTVVLGESSAALRGASVGDSLVIEGITFRVSAVTPDEVVSAAEVVFSVDDPAAPVQSDRFALISTDIARPDFEGVVRSLYDGPAPLRIRTEGETPWLRHGDAVLPQVFIKLALGEFSYTNRAGAGFRQSAAFRSRIVTTDVPILGEVTCHTVVVDMLAGAMAQLAVEGLEHLVDPQEFAGCWQPRFIRSASGTSAGLSRHSWGAAVDINAASNPLGSSGTQDPRLVEVMAEWGFTWGGDWLLPDPMHFEYGGNPG